jgi:hypothetical protein
MRLTRRGRLLWRPGRSQNWMICAVGKLTRSASTAIPNRQVVGVVSGCHAALTVLAWFLRAAAGFQMTAACRQPGSALESLFVRCGRSSLAAVGSGRRADLHWGLGWSRALGWLSPDADRGGLLLDERLLAGGRQRAGRACEDVAAGGSGGGHPVAVVGEDLDFPVAAVQVEALTDPEGDGWQVEPTDDTDWHEIADVCSSHYRLNGVLVSSYWSRDDKHALFRAVKYPFICR